MGFGIRISNFAFREFYVFAGGFGFSELFTNSAVRVWDLVVYHSMELCGTVEAAINHLIRFHESTRSGDLEDGSNIHPVIELNAS